MEIKQKVICKGCNNEMDYDKAEDYYWCDMCYIAIEIVFLMKLN